MGLLGGWTKESCPVHFTEGREAAAIISSGFLSEPHSGLDTWMWGLSPEQGDRTVSVWSQSSEHSQLLTFQFWHGERGGP